MLSRVRIIDSSVACLLASVVPYILCFGIFMRLVYLVLRTAKNTAQSVSSLLTQHHGNKR